MARSRKVQFQCERLDDRLVPANFDPTFGDKGIVIDLDPNESEYPQKVLTVNESSITFVGTSKGLEAVKLTASGKLDTSFGGGDGRITVAEKYRDTFNAVWSSEGQDSFLQTPFLTSAAVGRNGELVVVTTKYSFNATSDNSVISENVYTHTISRFKLDGSLDTTFGTNGQVTITNREVPMSLNSFTLGADGSLFFTGYPTPVTYDNYPSLPSAGTYGVRIFKMTANGQVDTTFGTNGLKVIDLGLKGASYSVLQGTSLLNTDLRAFQSVDDGDILIAGQVSNYEPLSLPTNITSNFFTARINADGTLDTAYGTNGVNLVTSAADTTLGITSLAVQSDGAIVATAGEYSTTPTSTNVPPTPFVFRIQSNGAIDSKFAGDGRAEVTSQFFLDSGRYGLQTPNIVEIPPIMSYFTNDEKAVRLFTPEAALSRGYYLYAQGTAGLTIQKLKTDGSVDTSFGNNGIVVLESPVGSYPYPYPLAVSSVSTSPPTSPTGNLTLPAFPVGYGILGQASPLIDGDLYFVGNQHEIVPFNDAAPPSKSAGAASMPLPYGRSLGSLVINRIDVDAKSPPLPDEPVLFQPQYEDIGIYTSTLQADINGDGTEDWVYFNVAPRTYFPTFDVLPTASVAPNSPLPTTTDSKTLPNSNLAFPVDPNAKLAFSKLWVQDGRSGDILIRAFSPFEESFTGGLVVAAGDIDGDGDDELIVGPDVGGGARIQVYEYDGDTTLATRDNFFAIDDTNFRGGARVACGDLDGDGKDDLIVGAGPGGGPRVAVYAADGLLTMSARPRKLANDFFAYPGSDAVNLRNGVEIEAHDVNADGKADLVFGAGRGGAPRVTVVDGNLFSTNGPLAALATPLADGFVGEDTTSRDGVRLTVTQNANGTSELKAYNGGQLLTRNVVVSPAGQAEDIRDLFEKPPTNG